MTMKEAIKLEARTEVAWVEIRMAPLTIKKAWTVPGPFRWEGTHYQHRVVNPWAVPLQKPYPRVWIPGVLSKETIIWAAKQRYPYIALNTSIAATKSIWQLYDAVARNRL